MMLRDFSEIKHEFTEKEMLFLQNFITLNATIPAYVASYEVVTTNQNTIRNMAFALRRKPHIKLAIEIIKHNALEIINTRFRKMTIDAAWVLHRTALLADFNIRKFIRVDEQGNAIYDFSNATDDDWYCISEYTVEEIAKGSGTDQYFVDKIKVKTVDKLRALELVGKHVDVAAFRDNIDISSKDGSMTPKASVDASKLSTAALAEILAAYDKPEA